jgi:hypothetical protein
MARKLSAIERTELVVARLAASAAGLWTVEGQTLVQCAFSAGSLLPPEVAKSFAEATRVVSMASTNLGIVRAAATGQPAVSLADALPADTSGSGGWLRAFGAARSIAVPLSCEENGTIEVLSVALASLDPDDETVIAVLRVIGEP